MDANTMRAKFNLQYEGARLGNRTFNDREITDFLNKSQLLLIKQRYDGLKNRTQRGFGELIRNAELDGIVSSSAVINNNTFIQGDWTNGALKGPDADAEGTIAGINATHNYGVYVALPNEAIYILHEAVTTANNMIAYPSGQVSGIIVKHNVPVKEVNYSEYSSSIYDPYNQPASDLVWSMGYGNFQPSTQNVGTTGTESVPTPVSIVDSTKTYTREQTGYNIKGIVPYTYGDTNVWIAFNSQRSRYLLPGKNWYIVSYQCHYLTMPPSIFVDVITPALQRNCVLADFLHQEVVDLAVKLASASIVPEQNKYQVNDIEAKMNE